MKKFTLGKSCVAILLLCVMVLNLSACTRKNDLSNKPELVCATVLEIEKYGHAVLDVTTSEFADKGYNLGDIIQVRFNNYESNMPFFDGYYSNPGEIMLRGTSAEDNIAICINYGDFSQETGIAIGDSVEITMVEKAGMLPLQELCALTYSNNREDFTDDAMFANFRAVTSGRIGDNKLYRTASPINNKHGRASYANNLIESVNIATVMNLADSIDDIEQYFEEEDFDSEYYRTLYENGKVIALDMSSNFFTDSFATLVVDGLKFFAQNDVPYCVHCTEGKDRAGFMIMILSALMGAELQEIIDDYMLTFYNYYGIEKGKDPERYNAVLDNNIIAMLCHVMNANSKDDLSQIDLEFATTKYLLNAGMTENEIMTLKEKLS